jgi:hypothetical protein
MAFTQYKKFKGLAGAAELYPELVHVDGSIVIGAAGAVVAPQPRAVTVAHGATGVYTLTLANAGGIPAFLTVWAGVRHDSATVIPYVQVRTAVASTGVITLTTGLSSAPGTAADLPSGAVLQFSITFRAAQITG